MRLFLLFFMLNGLLVAACGRVKQETKAAVNKTGDAIGQTASELGKGLSEGIDKTFACTLELAPSLVQKGLRTGKFGIEADSSGYRNQLAVYLIFEEDYQGPLRAKVFDEKGLEYGRVAQQISARKGDAYFVNFSFKARTDLENNSKFLIEL